MSFKQYFYKVFLEAKMECPEATQDLALNTKNRNATRDNHAYGPLNPMEPSEEYWESLAEKWNASVEEAKASRCSNCVAFDISPRMFDCMPGLVMTQEEIDDAIANDEPWETLGYCWMHHFKCHSARTCYTWAAGGPIIEDEKSFEWQDKNPFPDDVNEFVDGSYGMRGRTVPMGAIIREKD